MLSQGVGRWGLRVAGFAGLAAFLFFFVLSYRTPEWLETYARDYIEQQVRDRIQENIRAIAPNPADSELQKLATALYDANADRIAALKRLLENRTNDLFLLALDQVRDLDCESRARIELAWTRMNAAEIATLATDNERILRIIHGGYMVVVEELRTELRIFTATNAACFLALLLVSFVKPGASRHLMVPGGLLLCATLFCAWMYLFQQHWLLTLIHGDYVGWAYAGYLGLVFLLLCDIALNRGRVTCRLANGAVDALGGAATSVLTPC